jgi:hypothetical protein
MSLFSGNLCQEQTITLSDWVREPSRRLILTEQLRLLEMLILERKSGKDHSPASAQLPGKMIDLHKEGVWLDLINSRMDFL